MTYVTSRLFFQCQQLIGSSVACGAMAGIAGVALASFLRLRVSVAASVLGLVGLSAAPVNVAVLAVAFVALSALAGHLVLPLPRDFLFKGFLWCDEGLVKEAVRRDPSLASPFDYYLFHIDDHKERRLTPAMAAVYQDMSLDLIRFLFDQGAKNQHEHVRYTSVLRVAAEAGRLDVVRFLVEEQDCDPTDSIPGDYPLREKSEAGLRYVHCEGAPIHRAIQQGHFDVAEYLITRGAALDVITDDDNFKNTPLTCAMMREETDIASRNSVQDLLYLLVSIISGGVGENPPKLSLNEIEAKAEKLGVPVKLKDLASLGWLNTIDTKLTICQLLFIKGPQGKIAIELAELVQKIAASQITR